jgi:hypothetical protein
MIGWLYVGWLHGLVAAALNYYFSKGLFSNAATIQPFKTLV